MPVLHRYSPRLPSRLELLRALIADEPVGTLLDLGANDGYFAHELAKDGWDVLAVEGQDYKRDDAYPVPFEWCDVRTFEPRRAFDLVLCLGLFYHLPKADQQAFADRLRAWTSRTLILDTELGHGEEGHVAGERLSAISSIDGTDSFWPSRDYLLRMLERSGFSLVKEGCISEGRPCFVLR